MLPMIFPMMIFIGPQVGGAPTRRDWVCWLMLTPISSKFNSTLHSGKLTGNY